MTSYLKKQAYRYQTEYTYKKVMTTKLQNLISGYFKNVIGEQSMIKVDLLTNILQSLIKESLHCDIIKCHLNFYFRKIRDDFTINCKNRSINDQISLSEILKCFELIRMSFQILEI